MLCKGQTENISDGGVFVTVPIASLPGFGAELDVSLSIPRSTPNTYMLENICCKGRVLRHAPLVETDRVGVVLEFSRPQPLMLEV